MKSRLLWLVLSLTWLAPPVSAATVDGRQTGPSSRRTPLTITEIMYHPGPETNNLEYIELFNTEPVARDLSGWRISGDVDYLFASGTVLAGRSYLVVASDPAAVQARYGLGGVLGPFLGNLPNDRGTVRLRDNLGAVLLEVQYADEYPWPVAADGAGHSLQLAKPDFGEGAARAWSASGFMGGSPGRPDPLDLSPLREVVINEVLYNTDLPQMDFIELFNRGTQTVDISGCGLSDTLGTNKFRIPEGTVLAPGGLAVFGQDTLGFALSGHGDEVYLRSGDGSFVMDAVRFGPGETGVSLGRYPEGAEGYHFLSLTTPGATNAALLLGEIVINEIMYHPITGDDRDEYVELHNRSSAAVDLSGWQFTAGISLVFPEGTTIGPHGYLVAAKDVARLKARYPGLDDQNSVGDYGGSLSDRGERLALARPLDPASPNTDLVLVDEVIYGDGEEWGRWADGGGSSLELTDPSSDNRRAMNWRGSDESQKSTNLWTQLAQTRVLRDGNGPANELHVFLTGAGECLVDNVVAQKAGEAPRLEEGFEAGTAGWQFWGNHVRSGLESGGAGYQSLRSLHVRASGAGEATGGDSVGEDSNPAYNRLTVPLDTGFAAAETVRLECRARWVQGSPVLVLGLKGLWMEAAGLLEVPANLGTPGAPNSRRVENAGPAVWDATHAPVLPRAFQPVLVTCRAHDTDGIASLSLRYRLDPATAAQTAPMRDDGLGGDALAHDGAYTATLPGQPAGTLLAFTLLATDARGATTQFPEPGLTGAPRRECLIRFGEVELAGTLGAYRMWMSSNLVKTWIARPARSDEPLDMTFVAGNDRVIYNASVRYRGNWRSYNGPDGSARCSYSVDFTRTDRFLGDNEVKLDMPGQNGADAAIQRERHSSWFAAALGLPASNLRFVHVFFNGSDRGVNGLLTDKDIPGRALITSVFGDPDPLYFENTRFANDRTRFSPLSDVRNPDGTRKQEYYRWYFGRGPTDVPSDDYEQLYRLIEALNTTDAGLYTVKAQALIDLDNWMGIFAVNHIIGNGDSLSWRNSKNTAVYAPPAGRARTFLIDTDQCFGIGANSGANENLFTCNDAVIARVLEHPPFRRIFWRYAEEAVQGPMQASRNDAEVEAWFNALQAEGATPSRDSTTTMKTYVSGRRAYILSQLAGVKVPFRLTLNGGAAFSTNRNLVELTGTAPVAVASITVNGVAHPVTWDSVNQWRLEAVLAPGGNALLIEGLDRHGTALPGASATMEVTFTGAAGRPEDYLGISEILCHPQLPGTGFVEIHNASSDTAFDLSGYRLQGVDFDFPPGTVVQPGQSLAVAEDPLAFRQAFGWTANVVGPYAGQLQPDGETLTLLRPGVAADQIIDRVRYESVPPWPTRSEGGEASLQVIDLSRDNSRVSNWSGRQPTPGARNSGGAALPPYPPLWLNEVYASSEDGFGEAPGELGPWVELFNAGDTAVLLDGFYLSDNYTNLAAWPFPSNAAIAPGQFLVIVADGEPGQTNELHAGFRLTATNGAVVLSRAVNDSVQLLDYLNYTGLAAGHAYGDLPDGQPFYRRVIAGPTPGRSNTNVVWPAVRINEWMADNAGFLRDPADSKAQDWFELYNPNARAVDLKGWFLSDVLTNRLAFRIPDTCLIPARGFLLVWADGEPGQNATNRPDLHVNFKLEKAGEAIVLSAPDGRLIDAVEFKAQATDLAEGRVPGQADLTSVLAFGTPGAANAAPPAAPAFEEVFVRDTTVTLRLGTVSNFTYRVEYQDQPWPTNWVALGAPARAPGPTLTISDVLTTNGQRFYRAVRTP